MWDEAEDKEARDLYGEVLGTREIWNEQDYEESEEEKKLMNSTLMREAKQPTKQAMQPSSRKATSSTGHRVNT